MTKFYILRKLRKGSKDDFKVEINYEITYHIKNEKKKKVTEQYPECGDKIATGGNKTALHVHSYH